MDKTVLLNWSNLFQQILIQQKEYLENEIVSILGRRIIFIF